MATSSNQDVPTLGTSNQFGKELLSKRFRVEEFVFNQIERYLVIFFDQRWIVLAVDKQTRTENSNIQKPRAMPYKGAEILEMDIIAATDSMLIFHQDHKPRRIKRTNAIEFQMEELDLVAPLYQFNDELSPPPDSANPTTITRTWNVTFQGAQITALPDFNFSLIFVGGGGSTGSLVYDRDLPASMATVIRDGFVNNSFQGVDENGDPVARYQTGDITVNHVGGHVFTIQNDKASPNWNLTGFADDDKTKILVESAPLNVSPDPVFDGEPAWSSTRGWPRSGTFHDGRLWLGGTKSLPRALFGSSLRNVFDFSDYHVENVETVDPVTGSVTRTDTVRAVNDDDGIFVIMDTDQVDRISHVISNRDLQVFTTGGEFTVNPDRTPITPGNIAIQQQTSHGSFGPRPKPFNGATVFADRSGNVLRQFVFSNGEKSYIAPVLNPLSKHLIKLPQDMAVVHGITTSQGMIQDENSYLYVVNSDGTLAVMGAERGLINENEVSRQVWMGPWDLEHRDQSQAGQQQLKFEVGLSALQQDDTLTGFYSRATVRVRSVTVDTGDWSTLDAAGSMIVDTVVGVIRHSEPIGVEAPDLTNPDFETSDLTGWTDDSVGTGTASGATNDLVLVGTDTLNYGAVSQIVQNIEGGRDHVLWVARAGGGNGAQVRVVDNDDSSVLLSWSAVGSPDQNFTFSVPANTANVRIEVRNSFSDFGTATVNDVRLYSGFAADSVGTVQGIGPKDDNRKGKYVSVAVAGRSVFFGTIRTLGIKPQFAPVGTPGTSLRRTNRFVEEMDYDLALDCAVGTPSQNSVNTGTIGTLFDYAAGKLDFRTWGHLDGEDSTKVTQIVKETRRDDLGFEVEALRTGYTAVALEAGIGAAAAGFITIQDPMHWANVGLNYFVELETVPIEAPPGVPRAWAQQMTRRRIMRVRADIRETGGFKINGNSVQERTVGTIDNPVTFPDFVETNFFIDAAYNLPLRGWSEDPTIRITQNLPVPLVLGGLVIEFESDKTP